MKKKVGVIGLGYVGLPLACAIGSNSDKYDVVGYDISEDHVLQIRDKKCPIDDVVCAKDLKKSPIEVSSDEGILGGCDYFIICVPTPVSDDFQPDYSPILSAVDTISKIMKKGSTVILESTVNPGTCDEIVAPALEKTSRLKAGKDFILAHCPERINPGDNKWNIYNIPRNVGAIPDRKSREVSRFYESFIDAEITPLSSVKAAEATKIIENSFRDVNIAFVNELAKSFDALGIDVAETLRGAGNKPFGFMQFSPGRGVGGHCIAVDPYYLINRAAKSGFEHRFLKVAREINNSMPLYTTQRLQDGLNEIGKAIKGTPITLLGLSYKENVGDFRESPCLKIKELLEEMGADLRAFDPYSSEMSTHESLDESLDGAVGVVLCTPHKEFLRLTSSLSKHPSVKVLVDGMNTLSKKKITDMGIAYRGIGR